MPTQYVDLPFVSMDDVQTLASQEERTDVTLDSPAMAVFTNFQVSPPVVVEETTSINAITCWVY